MLCIDSQYDFSKWEPIGWITRASASTTTLNCSRGICVCAISDVWEYIIIMFFYFFIVVPCTSCIQVLYAYDISTRLKAVHICTKNNDLVQSVNSAGRHINASSAARHILLKYYVDVQLFFTHTRGGYNIRITVK